MTKFYLIQEGFERTEITEAEAYEYMSQVEHEPRLTKESESTVTRRFGSQVFSEKLIVYVLTFKHLRNYGSIYDCPERNHRINDR